MEATLHALGEIVLKGLPTFFLLLLLHFYLKRTFFSPLEKVLAERYEATTGARKQAESAMARAEAKAKEYEEAIRAARTEVYKENEALRKQWREQQANLLAEARAKADSAIAVAKAELAADVRTARESLQADSERIAEGIAAAILGRAA
jgi:F-type H+-transporting ATPase subunit b